eukprot:3670513-Rhodomonas_salina.4
MPLILQISGVSATILGAAGDRAAGGSAEVLGVQPAPCWLPVDAIFFVLLLLLRPLLLLLLIMMRMMEMVVILRTTTWHFF